MKNAVCMATAWVLVHTYILCVDTMCSSETGHSRLHTLCVIHSICSNTIRFTLCVCMHVYKKCECACDFTSNLRAEAPIKHCTYAALNIEKRAKESKQASK